MQSIAPLTLRWSKLLSTCNEITQPSNNEVYFIVSMDLLLTFVALRWQGPAAARRNTAGTQQEESGQQSGNCSATDEPNSPHQSVSCCKPEDSETNKKLPRNSGAESLM